MPNELDRVCSLTEAVQYFDETMAIHPDRDMLVAQEAVLAGKTRRYPALSLSHLGSPEDTDEPVDELALPEVAPPDTPEGDLTREIIGMLEPLKMLNSVTPCFGLGQGPGTVVTCFGIPLNPKAVNRPTFHRSFDEVLFDPPPDPATSGLMPEMRDRILLIKDQVPEGFYIGLPDMQGPFNLANSICGEEVVLLATRESPEKLHRLMDRITDFWIEARRTLIEWIGEEWLNPWSRFPIICECSVNLISSRMYEEFVLPYDLRIAEAFGKVGIHPCSGPHVFRVTLENIPDVIWTEAGMISNTCAGSISVDDALAAIGDRPIALGIGQELPRDGEEKFIRADLDRYSSNPRLTFGYTGMHWMKKNRPMIREMHRRLDEYWEGKYGTVK